MAHTGKADDSRRLLIALRTHKAFICLAVLLLACAGGCVQSDCPLSEPENAVADAEAIGLWRNMAEEPQPPMRVERVVAKGAPKGLLRVTFSERESFFVWATRVGDFKVLNLPCAESSAKNLSPVKGDDVAGYRRWAEGASRPVWLAMMKMDGDQMLLWSGPMFDGHHFVGDPKETIEELARDPRKFFPDGPKRFARVSDVAVNGPKNAVTDEVGDEEPSREPPEWYKQRETPDPNMATLKIKRLTPVQARQLVAEKNAEQFGDPDLVLGLTTLDAETARQLARFNGHTLMLSRLTTLDAKTANALAEFKGFIWLDGLTSLDPATAKEIAGFRGDTKHPLIAESPTGLKGDTRNTLKLDGLKTLDANTAAALAKFEGGAILLQGVTTLDSAAAESLAKFNGDVLYLTRLELRDTDVAKALAHFKGRELHVQLPDTADTDVAKALAEFEGELPLLEPDVVAKVRSYRVRQDTNASPNSDVRVALFAMREAAQSHLVCDALRVMSYSKVEPEVIDKISRKVIDGMTEISIPLLEKQIEDSSGDQDAQALLEAIGRLQRLVVAEAEAIRHFAVVDATPASTLKVFEATRAYQKQVSELMQQLDGQEE